MGVEPLVITPDKDGIYAVLKEDGIAVHSLTYRSNAYPPLRCMKDGLMWIPRMIGRLLVNQISKWQLVILARAWKADIIHTNVSTIAIGYQAAKVLKIPHVWHIREYGDLDFGFRYFPSQKVQRMRYRHPNSYTVCITHAIQRFNNLDGWEHSKVIYNGIIEGNKHKERATCSYFLFAGRLEEAKGISSVLEAYVHYHKQAAHPFPLYVAGDTEDSVYKQSLLDYIETNGIKDHVNILGMQQNMIPYYSAAKAVIISSPNEGFGRVAVEAMSLGCLVIGYDNAGTKEQLDNGLQLTGGEIGLRFKTQTELVQHMLHITETSEEQWQPYIERAYRTVNQLYTQQHYAQSIVQFYHSML